MPGAMVPFTTWVPGGKPGGGAPGPTEVKGGGANCRCCCCGDVIMGPEGNGLTEVFLFGLSITGDLPCFGDPPGDDLEYAGSTMGSLWT
jgi:hypothetical protein